MADRSLTTDQGLAILSAALESGHHPDRSSDCSHLVHAIYERAGFPYAYVNSTQLYAGVDEFQRITRPQPGDLVAWPGHVGIVINPRQHSFFSALRTGPGVEPYDSHYWRRRGRPRFFRYVQAAGAPILAVSTQVANVEVAALGIAPAHGPMSPNTDLDAAETSTSDGDLAAAPAEARPACLFVPRFQIVNSSRPSPGQVRAVLLQSFNQSGEALRDQDVFRLPQSVIVVDNFEVSKVHLKGDEGWAEVRISGPFSIAAGHVNLNKHLERQHWGLSRRSRNTWELALPPDAIHLPREVAVRVLAHELAVLTEASSEATVEGDKDADKKVQLARLLDVLLAP